MKINTPRISHQTIDGEVVIINLENGCYYSLLGVSAALWQMVSAGWERAEISSKVQTAYPGEPDAASLAEAFVSDLANEGLIVDGESARADIEIALPDTWSNPQLEKFTDMQELLMLDPIHEVDAMGWPHKPVGS